MLIKRTIQDYVEDYDGGLHTYEIKWNSKKKVVTPKKWKDNYPIG